MIEYIRIYPHTLFRLVGIVWPPQIGEFHSNYTPDTSLKNFSFCQEGNRRDAAEDGENAFEMSKILG